MDLSIFKNKPPIFPLLAFANCSWICLETLSLNCVVMYYFQFQKVVIFLTASLDMDTSDIFDSVPQEEEEYEEELTAAEARGSLFIPSN